MDGDVVDSRSAAAWDAFRRRVEEHGGAVVEPGWLGALKPHRVRCAVGHAASPRPSHVQQGRHPCRTCAGRKDPAIAMAEFRTRLEAFGAALVEPGWLGRNEPHRIRCAAGHETKTRPENLVRGNGPCRACAGKDPATAWAAFRARVVEPGATVVEPEWLGVARPHRIRCAAGHIAAPYPGRLMAGGGPCRACAGLDPVTAWEGFRARVAKRGGMVLETQWLGALTPHRVRCQEGHTVTPTPATVQQGDGICRVCAGRSWDVFYVVVNEEDGHVKFGITSGDPAGRLRAHRRHGYRTVVRVAEGLEGNTARAVETEVLAVLRDAGHQPVKGREYYDVAALPLVLRVADARLTP